MPAGPFAPLDRHWKGWMRRHRRCSWPRPSYCPGGGAVDCVGGAAIFSFCDGPWKIRVLAGSGEFFCPSLAFSEDGTAAGAMSGEDPGRLAYHFLEESGELFLATAWAVFPFRLLGCSVFWDGRQCLWRQNPSSSAMWWPVVTFFCSGVQRFYGMSMCSM